MEFSGDVQKLQKLLAAESRKVLGDVPDHKTFDIDPGNANREVPEFQRIEDYIREYGHGPYFPNAGNSYAEWDVIKLAAKIKASKIIEETFQNCMNTETFDEFKQHYKKFRHAIIVDEKLNHQGFWHELPEKYTFMGNREHIDQVKQKLKSFMKK